MSNVKQGRKKRITGALLENLLYIRDKGFSLDGKYVRILYPDKPFSRGPDSVALFDAVKCNQIERVQKLLDKDPFIINEFNYHKQTALHCAANRNHYQIIRLLLQRGIRVNTQDYRGRTPLFLAVKYNYLRSVKALLTGKANPGLRDDDNLSCIDIAKDLKIENLLRKGFLLHICLPLAKKEDRERIWQNEGLYYFDNDNDDQCMES